MPLLACPGSSVHSPGVPPSSPNSKRKVAASDITQGGGQEMGAIVKVSKGSGRIQNPLKGK